MHKLCHLAIFHCATHHNICPFKMNNHTEKKKNFKWKFINYATWQKLIGKLVVEVKFTTEF